MSMSLFGVDNPNYRDINYGKVAKDEEGRFHEIAILVLKEEVTFTDKIRFESPLDFIRPRSTDLSFSVKSCLFARHSSGCGL